MADDQGRKRRLSPDLDRMGECTKRLLMREKPKVDVNRGLGPIAMRLIKKSKFSKLYQAPLRDNSKSIVKPFNDSLPPVRLLSASQL